MCKIYRTLRILILKGRLSMKIKKYCGAIIALAMMSGNVMAADVAIDGVKLDGNTVTISGTAEKADEMVTMVLRNSETNELMRVAQMKTDSEKTYKIVFDMPESFKGNNTDGEYTVTVNLSKSGGEKDTGNFKYVRESVRSEILGVIQSGDSAFITETLKAVDVCADALNIEGINGDRLMALGDDAFSGVFESALEGKDAASVDYPDIASDINRYIAFYELNDGTNVQGNLTELNPVFEEKAFNDMSEDEKEYIAAAVEKKVPVADLAEFQTSYDEISVLCKLNFARYSQLDKLMKTYETVIGLDTADAYDDYNDLSSAKKQKVQEGIVDELETKVYTFEDFIEILDDEVKAASKKTSTGGGGGGGGNDDFLDMES